ncbi:MAG: DNA replication and repair protein RecF [Patescibacteria group bacterium]
MIIRDILLSNFRIYSEEEGFEFSPDVNGIIGENAHGKTTLLEAVYMISRGKGFREKEEFELLTFGEENGHLIGTLHDDEGVSHERAIIYRGTKNGEDEPKLEKKFYLDKAPSGQVRYARSNPPVVLFAPQHMDIVVHGPSYRREYFNNVIASRDLDYYKAIREYDAVLRRRNALLENYIDMATLSKEIVHWNDLLLSNAKIIQNGRQKYIEFLHEESICAGKNFQVIYHKNRLDEMRVEELFEKEAFARRTLAGPQKDDFEFQIMTSENKYVSVHAYASRSQQRLAILWLKMRELEYKVSADSKPILLLDDVYSEFDTSYRHIITSIIPQYQTFVTATEEIALPSDITRNMAVLRV